MLTNDELDAIEGQHTFDEETSLCAWCEDTAPCNTISVLVGELRAERTRTETLRAALQPIAARACENYTSGPGSCFPHRKMVTDGPDFTGTADEACYPCVAWRALAASVEEPAATNG